MTTVLRFAGIDLGAVLLFAGGGVVGAWWLRRTSTLSIRNLYLPAVLFTGLALVSLVVHAWLVTAVVLPITAMCVSAAVSGRRWRLSDLGAGEELRHHEQARRWVWQAKPASAANERVSLRGQGEIVRDRAWPQQLPYVSMTGRGEHGPRLPLGA